MRLWLVTAHILLVSCSVLVSRAYEDITTLEDDDFAEFEQFDADEELRDATGFVADHDTIQSTPAKPRTPPPTSQDQFDSIDEVDDDIMVEDEDNEFEHFQDPEEFEGFAESVPHSSEQPKITISKVPIMVRAHWDAYWLEGILCCMLAAYALGYAIGRSKNTAIASNLLKLHKPLLDENFTLVGETGADVVCGGECGWRREAEHCFTMWCSGRTCCEGMLLTLKLIKRQDLVHVLLNMVRPSVDTLQFKVELGKDDADPFIMCIAQKKVANKLAKEMQDLSVYCAERRPGDKHNLPASMSVMSECAEATAGVLDSRVTAALNKYQAHIQYLHISDQFSGPKQMEDSNATKPPDTQKVLMLGITLAGEGTGEEVRPLIILVFYLLEKLKRMRLSKEAMNKCERNRQRVAEAFVRGTHAARQEQAAARREERRKQEKERILAEDDPEKQRRWELKEQKRQMKRKTPKMKQLKVKAL